MRGYRLHAFAGPDALRLEALPDPKPGHGEVLVRIRAAALNYRDLLVAKGVYNRKLPLPLIPLSDGMAGDVTEVVGQGHPGQAGRSGRGGLHPGLAGGEVTLGGESAARRARQLAIDGRCWPRARGLPTSARLGSDP